MTDNHPHDTQMSTPRRQVETALNALTLAPNLTHDLVIVTLNSAVAATYAEADEFIKAARTHAKAAQANEDIMGSLDRLADVIRAAIPHVPTRYAVDMEDWAQAVQFAGMPEDSSDGLESWAYEVADAMAHIGASPLPGDAADFDEEA